MVRITVLADNKVVDLRPQGLMAEWGFSALVEDYGILFDTGQTGIALKNLLILKKEFPEKLVLSHGHYDHTGGLMEFLSVRKLKIFLHPDAFLPRYYRGEYIGIPFPKEKIENFAEVIEHREPIKVDKNVWALGEIPRKYETALLSDSYLIKEGKKMDDEILDDQSLAIKTERGVVLLLGCCHSGLRNTVVWAEEVTGDEVKFVIGGTHLIALKGERLMEVIKWLDRKIELIAPCHCTGIRNELILMEHFKERFKMVGSGSTVEI